MSNKKLSRVVVAGGGIAGLGAAAVLANHASEVILLEKGKRLAYPAVRKNIPQGHHIHILLKAGQNFLDEIFPGFSSQLIAEGASRIQAGTGQRIYEFGKWSPSIAVNLEFLGVSRPFLEDQMFTALCLIPNIKRLEACEVLALSNDGHRINAITFQDEQGEVQPLSCDLLVDASGAGSRLWKQGIRDESLVQIEQHEIDIFYSTLIFKPKTRPQPQRENILLVPASPQELGASLIDIEKGLTCVSLHGVGRHMIPETTEDWLTLVRDRLPNRDVWQRIDEMEPCTELKTMRRKHMQWIHFEKFLDNILEGYFPIGDVINQVNPIFGQGMTLALGHCTALGRALEQEISDLGKLRGLYLKAASDWSNKAWRKCRNYSVVTSSGDDKLQLIHRLAKQKLDMSHSDPQLYQVIVSQSQMLG